ncbi:MAG: hypothetical protein M1829_000253 [Trizodia sp. TS-e1964]|nr:MAG: hypothetical protein M1829_000253 [Trizodia sp. TS-e1964]
MASSNRGQSYRKALKQEPSAPQQSQKLAIPQIRFIFRLSEVKCIKPSVNSLGDWRPATTTNRFTITSSQLYLWQDGITSRIYEQDQLALYGRYHTFTVFVDRLPQSLLAVHCDVTKVDVNQLERGWSRIGFDHLPNNISFVESPAFDYERLAAPADGASWFPQLVPHQFNWKPQYDHVEGDAVPVSGGLAGRLSLLLALALLSGIPERSEWIVENCFRRGWWIPHPFITDVDEGRTAERGVIATVYLDPQGSSEDTLRRFELAEFGAIFAS